MKTITILSPAYNEAKSLPLLVSGIDLLIRGHFSDGRYCVELLVVNDGSSDDSLDVLAGLRRQYPFVNYLNLSRNFGKESALLAGFDYAQGDCVIVMDADCQHPVDVIPELVKCWEEGYDDVYGERITRGKESFVRKKLTLAYYKMLQKSTKIDILPNVGDFRLLDRRCVDLLRQMRETQRYSKGLFAWIGFRKKAVEFETAERRCGKSSFSFGGLVRLAVEGVTSYTTAPLRFATLLGLVVSLVAFVYIVFVLVKTIFWGEPVQGYPTLLCVILFLGGCQLLALGIIGEYIARIFNESKRRPVYVAESLNGQRIERQNELPVEQKPV